MADDDLGAGPAEGSEPDQAQGAATAAAERLGRPYQGKATQYAAPHPEPVSAPESDDLLPSDRDEIDHGEVDLHERARLGFVNSYYRNTLMGSTRLSTMAHFVTTPDEEATPAETKRARDSLRDEYGQIVADLARYDALRPWGDTLEGAAALGGAIGGGMLSPESMLGWSARGATAIGRTIRAAVQQGSIQAAVDPIVQWMGNRAGVEHGYDPSKTAMAFGAGAIIGGGMHGIGELISNIGLRKIQSSLASEDPQFRSGVTERFDAEDALPDMLPSDRDGIVPGAEAPEAEPRPNMLGKFMEDIEAEQATRGRAGERPITEVQEEPETPEGVVHRVSVPGGQSVEVKPRVMEASHLLTSADTGYDASLQPRDRTRAASDQQIREIAANLDPERLGFSAEADRGAPIIGPDFMVESGNGRVLSIREAYRSNPDAADRYRNWIASQGIDVSGFREPVLVRERVTQMTPEERQQFALAANQASTLAFSAPERAMADARLLEPQTLDLIRNPDDLGAIANRDFVRAFVGKLPQAEHGALMNAEGGLSVEGLSRVRNAVIARAYGDSPALARIAEAVSDDVKSISNGLVSAAPQWAKLRADIASGLVRPDVDQTAALVEAVGRTADLRAKGQKLDTFLDQQDAFERVSPIVEDFMRMFYDPSGRRASGANRIADALKFYAEEGRKVSEGGLDLGLPEVSVAELQRLARENASGARTPEATLFLRGRPRGGANAEAAGRQVQGQGSRQESRPIGTTGTTGNRSGPATPGDLGDTLAARASGDTLPMERARPEEGVPTEAATETGRELTEVPTTSPQQDVAIQSLQQQAMGLADALGVPYRQGRVRPSTALGTFNTASGVIRTKEIADFEVLAHEAGHHIEAKLGQELTDLTESFASELTPLVSDPAAYDPSQYVKEGFAEFVRRYIGNPAHAELVAPNFTTAFRRFLQDNDPAMLKAVDDASAAYRAYLEAPSVDAVGAVRRHSAENEHGWRGTIARIKEDGFFPSVNKAIQSAYDAIFDQFGSVPRAMRQVADAIRQLEGTDFVQLKAVDNPEFRLRMLGRSQQAAVIDAMKGVVPYGQLQHEGPSLSEAMAKAMGDSSVWGKWDEVKKANFSSYLIARRAAVLWDKFNRGDLPRPPVAFSRGDAITAMADFERAHPTFREASDMVHVYTRQLLRKMYEGGLIDQELATKLVNEPFYVPFMRDRSDKPLGGGGGTGTGPEGPGMTQVVARQTGSTRDIIDPIESILTQTFLVNRTLRHNDVIKAFVNYFGRAGIEGGQFVEKVPAQEARRYTFDLGQAIENKAVDIGMSPDDAKLLAGTMSDLSGEDPLMGSFFKMEPAAKRGEPIVFYKENGKLKAARFISNSEGYPLYELVTALPSGLSDVATQVLATSAGLLRSGITTNPVFMLTNFIRDQVAAGILRSDYIPFFHGVKGIAEELRQGQAAELYGAAGGVSAGAHIAPLEQAGMMKVDALKRSGYLSHRVQDLHGLLELASLTEAGTRNSIFKTVFDQKRAQGLSDYEAMWEAAFQAQDILDFSRWGSKTQAMRALTPFLNAHLQGLDKARRTLFDPILQRAQGGALLEADKDAYKNALLSWTKLLGVGGVLGAAWAAIHQSDRHYQDAPPELVGTHFVTSIGGKLVVIPKPFELGLGFTAGEYAYRRMMQDDQRAAGQFAEAAWDVLKPPVPYLDNPFIKTTYELGTGMGTYPNFWNGRPIVPDTLKGLIPAEQYTDRTSNLAKQIGKVIGVSPMKVDHAIGGYFGLWGRDAMALSNSMEEDRPVGNWSDHVFMRRFIKDPTKVSDVTTQFWKFMARSTGQFNQAVGTYDEYIKRRSSQALQDASAYLGTLTPSQRAYVTLKSGAHEDGKPAFNADEKRIHPLQRAYDAVSVLNGMRREMDKNNFAPFSTNEGVKLSEDTRGQIRDNIRELAQMEMYNALVTVRTPGYVNRAILDTAPTLEKISKLSPVVADDLKTRYATAKIYDGRAVAAAYPMLESRLNSEGSEADIGDLAFEVKGHGYEFGGDRARKPQKLRMPIPGRPVAAPIPAAVPSP